MDALNSLLEGVVTLPSPPAIAVKIIQEVKKDSFSLRQLANIISFDPALTAKILRMANSSFYSLPYKIDSIEKAVSVLGVEALKNIALSFVIVKGMRRDTINEFDHEFFWKRSITAAVSAEMIASKLKKRYDDAFVASLLMDIGIIVMYLCRPDDYMRVLDEKRVSGVTVVEAERAVFGFDHQDVSSKILKKWGIPENICLPIACHHNNDDGQSEIHNIADILKLSDLISSVYHGSGNIEKLGKLKKQLQDEFSVNEADIDVFIDSVAEKTVELLSFFEIDHGDMKPYSQILQDANEELGKLNLSYEQLLMQLKQEKKKVDKLAKEIRETNERLREVAFKDGLTGLYNHRYFQELMDKEIHRAERYVHPLSLIMLDIDYFKKINDTYGHLQGDVVLRSIGELLQRSIRTSDTSARYGGEEFIVVLPETDIKGTAILAERLRQMVEKLEIRINSHSIRVTVSLGVTTYESTKVIKSKAEIINTADRALYNSKLTGRNKLSIGYL